MPKTLAPDTSLEEVAHTLPQPRVYFAQVFHAMKKAPGGANDMLARIGVTGTGVMPNFRVESADGRFKQAYDGVSFKPFPEPKTHDANWSTHASTYPEVEALVIKQREIERKKPR